MSETNKEKLARAEFWATEAMNGYDRNSDQYKILFQACELVKKAARNEEDEAWHRVMMAAQKC